MSRTEAEFAEVKNLAAGGLSDYRIAQQTGISRSTVQRWRHLDRAPGAAGRATKATDWCVTDPDRYCYLLGSYLGDGHITHRPPNGWILRISCDRRYQAIIDEVCSSIIATLPGARPTRIASSNSQADVVSVAHPAIGHAFPQHGPGKKHLRAIMLADWQLDITREHPAPLIRGLIHSDGCRVLNRFRTRLPSGRVAGYSYVRYFFSNLSADIRAIFIDHCALLGVSVTQSNPRNLTVSHRDSVAILDSFVGPKR
jgi:Homeodomain-like domain